MVPMEGVARSSSSVRARLVGLLGLAATSVLTSARPARADANPHLSEEWLPSSNGMAAIAWDREQYKLVQFLEHPYAAASPTATTRNFLYDSYPGVRIGGTGTWLNTVAPVLVEYLPGTGIVHAQRTLSGLTLDEYDFAPQGLAAYASIMLLKVTQTGSAGPVDVYSLFNYQLGAGTPPTGTQETITYDATRDAYYESGASGVAFGYASLTPSSYHGCTPNNPFGILNAGGNLMDDPGTGGPIDNSVPGFQSSLGTLAQGASATVGWLTVLAPDANAQNAVDAVRAWINGRSPAELLSDEQANWKAWIKPAPSGSSALESALAAQAQVVLRMGQVTESGQGSGQILASVAPGMWNIAWVRDMAYATVGLIKSGHLAEAKAAIAFQMGASAGQYEAQVGAPYQISVVRYYGNGTEWSDSNSDGPNIEFDGFGLFLWELEEYVKASGDTASLQAWWPTVKSKIAGVLVGLQEPSGIIAADSSIWEVHWDGQQKHFAYTTITAANGLCAASSLAKTAGDATSQAAYLAAGQRARDGVVAQIRAPDGTLAQSTEQLMAGSGWLDAAVMEAINFGVIDPKGRTASATLASIQRGLVPQSGRGFMRSDAGDSYSSNEWVFIDLRAARALELAGQASNATSLFAWNVAQASDNYGELSELHDPVTADYAGQCPMVGFGAGAYLIRLFDRGTADAAACETYAVEPPPPAVGTGGSGGGAAAGTGGTGGAMPVVVNPSQGDPTQGGLGKACSCGVPRDAAGSDLALALVPLALCARRRRRRS